MAEDRDALLKLYKETREELHSAVNGLSDESMVETSLDGWSVKDHLAHLALWDDVLASEVARISAGHQSAWRTTDEQGTAYNELGYELRRGLSLKQVRWELESSRQGLLDAIASISARGLDASLYGEAELRSEREREHAGWIRHHRERALEGRQ